MKTIKIFLSSSEELKEERKELADIIANINHTLSRRDIFVDLAISPDYLIVSPAHIKRTTNLQRHGIISARRRRNIANWATKSRRRLIWMK